MLFQQENEKEENNFYKVRQIELKTKLEGLHVDPEWQIIARKIQDSQVNSVPEHLKDLYERSKTNITEDEKRRVVICSLITRTHFHVTNGI